MLLKNKCALITGASKGIGKAIAITFAENGADLVLISRNMSQLQKLQSELSNSYGSKIFIYNCDVRNELEIKNTFNLLKNDNIALDILVNNAGVMIDSMLMTVKYDDIAKNFETNTFSQILFAQAATRHFIKKRGGSIINISSIIGLNGAAGQSVYSASKSAIIGFSKSISKELAPLNIRVNVITPGFIETDLTVVLPEEVKERVLKSIGLKSFGKPSDVANAALFLASDLAGYITGQVIGVDGGMLI